MNIRLFSIARLLTVLAALAGLDAQATPIVFTTTSYDTTAFAVSGALADTDSDATPSPLPLVSTATVVAPNDFATAFALAASGLLSTSAEADTFAGAQGANAGAQSHFLGTFLGSGLLTIRLGFDDLNSVVGGAASSGTLFVLVTSTVGTTTTTLFNNFFTVGGNHDLSLITPGGINTLDLVLFSQAATTGAGQGAQNFSQIVFSGDIAANAVPEPATVTLLFAGVLTMLAWKRRNDRAFRRSDVGPSSPADRIARL